MANQSQLPVGGASTCQSTGLQAQRSSPGGGPRSSRNDYMKSGLYSTFTIQSLQGPCKNSNQRPIKTELMLAHDHTPKAAVADSMMLREVSGRSMGGVGEQGRGGGEIGRAHV